MLGIQDSTQWTPTNTSTSSPTLPPNTAIALLCVVLAGGAFMFGYVVAGVLILAVSVALVVNAESHRRRGDSLASE